MKARRLKLTLEQRSTQAEHNYMIKDINELIDSFFIDFCSIEPKMLETLQKKYTTSITDDLSKGHITSNVCMIAAGILKKNPAELSKNLAANLSKFSFIESAESAGPGFVNIRLSRQAFLNSINIANMELENYGRNSFDSKKKIQIEFVSANPTGPLHVGHGRGAAYGDAIGRILEACGHEVHKEYYVNDAGRQIDILTASVCLRLADLEDNQMPESSYKGGYIKDIADDFRSKSHDFDISGEEILNAIPLDDAEKQIDEIIKKIKVGSSLWSKVKKTSLSIVLDSIKEDLQNFNVLHDDWYFESSLGSLSDESSSISQAMSKLEKEGLAYKENGALWLDTSSSKDDKNRVLIREDGRPTYFASDVAYHKNKIDRGFDELINVWGADHHGYIKRIEASIDGLGFDKEKLNVQLVQFANLFRDGKKVKMSTRSGDFYTLANLVGEIGKDAARFYYLSKQADQHLDFDIDLAKADNKENIFYYIQYAHARICSLQAKYIEKNGALPISAEQIETNKYAKCDRIIHEVSKFPGVVHRSAKSLQPHLIIYFLKDFAQSFHSFYNDNHILSESDQNAQSILFCLNASKQVLANGLRLLGIEPIQKM